MSFKKKMLWLCLMSMTAGEVGAEGMRLAQAVPPAAEPVQPGVLPQRPTQGPQYVEPNPYDSEVLQEPRHRLRDMSWIHIGTPPPRKLKVHDIIKVIVDEKSEVTQDSRFNRQRNAIMKAQLNEWIRIDDMFRLKPAATDSPTIDTQLRSQLNSFGTANSREGMKYRIAATVVDVLPNGTLILEARKSIETNGDLWEYSLTGRIRSQDVLPDNSVLSENVADLAIAKREYGKVRDSTKRGILLKVYDTFLPF